MPEKPCERQPCLHPALPGERYCHACRGKVKYEMKKSGYLPDWIKNPPARRAEAREKQNETGLGIDR